MVSRFLWQYSRARIEFTAPGIWRMPSTSFMVGGTWWSAMFDPSLVHLGYGPDGMNVVVHTDELGVI